MLFPRSWTTLLVAVLAATSVYAGPTHMVLKERVAVPRGWHRVGAAADHDVVTLSLSLKQVQRGSIEDKLDRTSDPDSPEYLQHLSRKQVLALLKPSAASSQAVDAWLGHHNLSSHAQRSMAGDYISMRVPVSKARELLGDAHFAVYEHKKSAERVIRTTEYHLPLPVSDHIDFVGGTTYFSTPRSLGANGLIFEEKLDKAPFVDEGHVGVVQDNGVPASCNASAVTSLCLRELYRTHGYTPQAPDRSHIGIAGFLGEHANYEDLANFLKHQRPDAYRGKATFNYIALNGEHNNQSLQASTGEAALDIQTVEGVTWPIRTSFYSVGGSPPFKKDKNTPTNTNEPYAELLEYLLQLPDHKLPDVLSISYGDDEQSVPVPYAKRVCTLFAALGLRGVSVFESSGDQGVGSTEADDCVTNDKRKKKTFLPSFPTTCPYITTVGATKDFGPEKATTLKFSFIISGGGFSNLFPRPWYQAKAVPRYLKNIGTTHQGLFNPLGRAYPDVAAQGSRFVISVAKQFELISGTSASTPLFASVISLLNDARIAKHKATLGFLNPLIYKRLGGTDAFNDVTIGNSKGCGTHGFDAQHGWDPVTGFGTPNFTSLLRRVLAL